MPRPKLPDLRVNEEFREWTRGTSFTLCMGKTQVATLVSIHASKDVWFRVGQGHKLLNCFVTAADGLIKRGLVLHFDWVSQEQLRKRTKFSEFYKVTDAGEHVVALLQLSGIYQELLKEFERFDSHTSRLAV